MQRGPVERFLILEKEHHTLFSTETCFKEKIWLLVYQFALEWSGQGYLGIYVAKLELKKEKAHLFSECAGLITLCLVFSHVIYI